MPQGEHMHVFLHESFNTKFHPSPAAILKSHGSAPQEICDKFPKLHEKTTANVQRGKETG